MECKADSLLVEALYAEEAPLRMLALHMLCESYASDPSIMNGVVTGWNEWGFDEAFPEFPMLSYVPTEAGLTGEFCELAAEMVAGRALTDKATRCAGKLIEQLVQLPAAELAEHMDLLETTVAKSKIFFRVDLAGLRQRIELLDQSADALAQQLDGAIAALANEASDASALQRGLHALEALRRNHPDYMHLQGVLAQRPPNDGPAAVSFQVTMQSLMAMAQPGSEQWFAKHLHDERESVTVNAVEALVRCRSPESGRILAAQFHDAPVDNQPWLARGLQRLHTDGLAETIAELRSQTEDPMLWGMLLIAETRQLDASSIERLALDLGNMMFTSLGLVAALQLFGQVHRTSDGGPALFDELIDYLERVKQQAANRG